MHFFPSPGASFPFPGRPTLIIPSVSWGNVDQLAVDLLLTTSKDVHRVGILFSPHALPVAGCGAFVTSSPSSKTSMTLCQNLEVFCVSSDVYAVQLRAGACPGQEEVLCHEVAVWANSAGFGRVLLLAGADATMRVDAQLRGSQLRVVSNTSAESTADSLCSDASVHSFPCLELASAAVHVDVPEDLDPTLSPEQFSSARSKMAMAVGTGYAVRFLRQCDAVGLAATLLLLFVYEGDNVGDARGLADAVAALLPAVGTSVGAGAGAGADAVGVLEVAEEGVSSGIGLADLDRDYPEEIAASVRVPRQQWREPAAWAVLSGGPAPFSW